MQLLRPSKSPGICTQIYTGQMGLSKGRCQAPAGPVVQDIQAMKQDGQAQGPQK